MYMSIQDLLSLHSVFHVFTATDGQLSQLDRIIVEGHGVHTTSKVLNAHRACSFETIPANLKFNQNKTY